MWLNLSQMTLGLAHQTLWLIGVIRTKPQYHLKWELWAGGAHIYTPTPHKTKSPSVFKQLKQLAVEQLAALRLNSSFCIYREWLKNKIHSCTEVCEHFSPTAQSSDNTHYLYKLQTLQIVINIRHLFMKRCLLVFSWDKLVCTDSILFQMKLTHCDTAFADQSLLVLFSLLQVDKSCNESV